MTVRAPSDSSTADAGVITAQMADEKPLGKFKTANEAMRAILDADRAAREAA